MKLFGFQRDGAAWLQDRNRAYLADDPGLGKTIQVIQALKARGAIKPTVICPASAVPVWHREAERWNLHVDLAVMSYDKFVRNAHQIGPLFKRQTDVLVLDEAHYLKSPEAARSKLILGRHGITTPDMAVWLLSGTPSPNHYGELFVPLASLWPHVLVEQNIRTYEDFLNEFTVWEWVRIGSAPPRRRIIRSKNGPKFKYLLNQHDVMLRRTMDEVGIQLPGIFWQEIPVNTVGVVDSHRLDEERELARHIEQTGAPLPEESFGAERRALGERKLAGALVAIKEMLEADPSSKHVVMAYHLSVLDGLEAALAEYGAVRIDGGTTNRGELVERFQTNPGVRVFIGQAQACREAITLTASATMHIVEPFWTPAYNVQLAGRIRRISQGASHVLVRMYYDPSSPLDTAMTEVLARKGRDLAIVYDGDGA